MRREMPSRVALSKPQLLRLRHQIHSFRLRTHLMPWLSIVQRVPVWGPLALNSASLDQLVRCLCSKCVRELALQSPCKDSQMFED